MLLRVVPEVLDEPKSVRDPVPAPMEYAYARFVLRLTVYANVPDELVIIEDIPVTAAKGLPVTGLKTPPAPMPYADIVPAV